jgi:molybdate transport system substrate-binding protein
MDAIDTAALQVARLCLKGLMAGAVALGAVASAADAAEIRIVSRPELARVITALGPQIGALVGPHVTVEATAAGAYDPGFSEPFDVAVVDQWTAEALLGQGKVRADGIACIAWTGLGMAVRVRAAWPDIGTVEALRRTLLAAGSIAYSGDEHSGAQFRTVLVQLGIASEIEPKLIDTGHQHPTVLVAQGRADLAIALESEIETLAQVQAAGALAPEVQHFTPFFAAVGVEAADPAAARRLTAFLGSFEAAVALHDNGLDTAITE